MALDLLEDVIGKNEAGLICHPYKGQRGEGKGLYSYTLETENNRNFINVDELKLRSLIEKGQFNEKGRIRMVPAGSVDTARQGALNVLRYNGHLLPIRG
ncbi:hypothetical protein [Pseudomonas sp. QD4]|uniref:hypothetical protein n=1 Tax=Pseudomonas sp. QD4 TaxID=3368618 RepID=UPI003BA0182C